MAQGRLKAEFQTAFFKEPARIVINSPDFAL